MKHIHTPRRLAAALSVAALLASAASHPAIAQQGPGGPPSPAAVNLHDNLSIDLFAAEPLLGSPVALSLDNHGRAYVTQTIRRRNSALPIREHTDWMTDDLSFQSPYDMRDFIQRKLSPADSPANAPWLPDRNQDGSHDWRDLTVQSDLIHRLTDRNADGRADDSVVYADGFNTVISDVAAGVLHHRGDIYLTLAPDLWRLRDTDGDGRADQRTSLSHGYGAHFGFSGHNMHGPVIGPDGMIYWSIGDIGLNVVDPTGRRWKHPHEGAVMRCYPDGSGFEVYATGLRNAMEICFNWRGDLITVDNDSDLRDDRERIVHVAEGSDSGWRINWQYGGSEYNVWLEERLFAPHFPGQAAYILPPIASYSDGPAGFKYNPGTAISPEYRDHYFVAEFTGTSARGKISAFTLKEKGAGYELDDHHDVMVGLLPTGLDFGPDGALYLADWVEGWVPHSQGRVWKIDDNRYAQSAARLETKTLLAEGMTGRSNEELARLLAHDDMRIRMAAQFELADRGEDGLKTLADTLANRDLPTIPRLHAIWGIGQFGGDNDAATDLICFHSASPETDTEIRAASIELAGRLRAPAARLNLPNALGTADPRIRYHAAIALGKYGRNSDHVQPLISMIAENNDTDPWLRHAAIMGLTGAATSGQLADLATHPSPAVRIAAVVALRRQRSSLVARFLDDADEHVTADAARAIHDDFSIPASLPALAESLSQTGRTSEPLLRRAINANLRMGRPEDARRLASYAADSAAPPAMRVEALESLAAFTDPPTLDRVEGNYRPLGRRPVGPVRSALEPHAIALLADADPAVRAASARAAGSLGIASAAPALESLVASSAEPSEVRIAALAALGQLRTAHLASAVRAALASDDGPLRSAARDLLATLDDSGPAALQALTAALDSGSLPEQQAALATLSRIDSLAARRLIEARLDSLLAGQLPAALHLDTLEAAQAVAPAAPSLATKLEARRAALDPADTLAAYTPALEGGDAAAGRDIVLNNVAAQCVRCHRVGRTGATVAPDLTQVGQRADRRHLLESLVDPNAKIADGFGTVTLILSDGRAVAGTKGPETDTNITIQQLDGQIVEVDKGAITSRVETQVSAMPPMTGILTPRQLRDVVEYLTTLR